MSALSTSQPTWVHKRDGRLAPFDPDQITLTLFDATETLGPGDAFLARELTEGVLYFLAEEVGAAIPTTAQIAEIVAKVVRELGHPALAQAFVTNRHQAPRPFARQLVPGTGTAFAAQDPGAVVQKSLTAYSLGAIFTRDLRAAHEEGLITLHGLAAPLEMAACVLALPDVEAEPPRFAPLGLMRALDEARAIAGCLTAIDGPEHGFSRAEPSVNAIHEFCETLRLGARASGLRVLLNLNSATPPAWAAALTAAPLFATTQLAAPTNHLRPLALALREQCLRSEQRDQTAAVDWHLSEDDFPRGRAGQNDAGLTRLARCFLEVPRLGIVFDRPRRPHYLGPGLDRRHPTTLLAVSLHLPQLLRLPGTGADPAIFIKKAASLAGMAVSAALQKRAFLRDRNRAPDGTLLAINRRFLLARGRLVVVPVGLEAVTRLLTGHGLCEGEAGRLFVQRLLRSLAEVLQAHGARANLPLCLGDGDGLGDGASGATFASHPADACELAPEQVPGLTPWDARAPLVEQLRAADALHGVGERATATVLLAPDHQTGAEEVAELLRFAWRETVVQRLVLRRVEPQQLTLPGLS